MSDEEDFEIHELPESPTPDDILEHIRWLYNTVAKAERKANEMVNIRSQLLKELQSTKEVFVAMAPERVEELMKLEGGRHMTRADRVKARPFVEKAVLGWLKTYRGPQPIDGVSRGVANIHKIKLDEVQAAIKNMVETGEIVQEGNTVMWG